MAIRVTINLKSLSVPQLTKLTSEVVKATTKYRVVLALVMSTFLDKMEMTLSTDSTTPRILTHSFMILEQVMTFSSVEMVVITLKLKVVMEMTRFSDLIMWKELPGLL